MKEPFVPHSLPITNLDWAKLANLIGKANSALSNYNGTVRHLINPLLFLAPVTVQEAVLSSKIEGTRASLADVLQKDISSFDDRMKGDIEEVRNYEKALDYARNNLFERPLCLNMIKDIHTILMSGVRGDNKARGEFRRIQNYIGFHGDSIEQATFIPPSPEKMLVALHEWEKYMHDDSQERLIQMAVLHAQFEIIHPFLDGNGRLGRILIPLFLHASGYLDYPVFYLSEYLEGCRTEYYARLKNISDKNDWQGWVEFFLGAIIEQSKINETKVKSILHLYTETKNLIMSLTKSHYAIKIVDLLFAKPIIDSAEIIAKSITNNQVTTNRLLSKLVDAGILIKIQAKSGQRPNCYAFAKLINIVEGKKVF